MKFLLVVEQDAANQRWPAVFPELPGCASAGDSEYEAITKAKEVLQLWFEPSPLDLEEGSKLVEIALT